MKRLGIAVAVVVGLALGLPLLMSVHARMTNPDVAQEVRANPTGERAAKVMLLTLPSARMIPVDFLLEDGRVYAGADGRWWKELEGGPHTVKVFVLGESFAGRARAVLDDSTYTKDVFTRLRPDAVPGFGTLIEILLDPEDRSGPVR